MKKNLLALLLLTVTLTAFSQKNYWKPVFANKVSAYTQGKELFPGSFKPASYKLFSLDEIVFGKLLKQSLLAANISVAKSGFIIFDTCCQWQY